MSIEEFRAGRQWCTDLGKALQDARWEHESQPASGWLYCNGQLYIEQIDDGRFMLVIGNLDWIEDLASLEQRLYQFAMSEGYLA